MELVLFGISVFFIGIKGETVTIRRSFLLLDLTAVHKTNIKTMKAVFTIVIVALVVFMVRDFFFISTLWSELMFHINSLA